MEKPVESVLPVKDFYCLLKMDQPNLLQLEEPTCVEDNAGFPDYSIHLFPSHGNYSYHIRGNESNYF